MYQDESFKSINEKVYKLLLSQNDDNRELAETTFVSEEVDALMNDFLKLDAFILEFMNNIATGYDYNAPDNFTALTTIILQAKKKVLALDINNVSKASIDSIVDYKDKYTEVLNAINAGLGALVMAKDDPNSDYLRGHYQVSKLFEELITAINIKLLNYKQNVPDPLSSIPTPFYPPDFYQDLSELQKFEITYGKGYSFSLFNKSGYQPTKFLRI